MTAHVKVGGVWKNVASVHNKVAGVWKTAADMPVKVAGVWKTGILASGAFEPIATVYGSGQTSITFSSIPQTYQSLQIYMLVRSNSANYGNNNGELRMTFNGVTTNTYDRHYLSGTGSGAVAGADITSTDFSLEGSNMGGNSLADTYAASILDIHDYASTTKNKTIRVFAGGDANVGATNYIVRLTSLGWRNTSAITSITLNNSNGISSGSSFALYGIKGVA